MLLIEDLRVGSLVKRQGQPYKLQRRDIGECKYVNDAPIPLDAEILHFNGFCDYKNGVAFGKFKLLEIRTIDGLVYFHCSSDKPITAVHELQLVFFAIMNKELRVRIPELEMIH
jgi:hypothetical protein